MFAKCCIFPGCGPAAQVCVEFVWMFHRSRHSAEIFAEYWPCRQCGPAAGRCSLLRIVRRMVGKCSMSRIVRPGRPGLFRVDADFPQKLAFVRLKLLQTDASAAPPPGIASSGADRPQIFRSAAFVVVVRLGRPSLFQLLAGFLRIFRRSPHSIAECLHCRRCGPAACRGFLFVRIFSRMCGM